MKQEANSKIYPWIDLHRFSGTVFQLLSEVATCTLTKEMAEKNVAHMGEKFGKLNEKFVMDPIFWTTG